MGFSKQEYWSRLPRPSPGHIPDPGLKPTSLMSPALAGECSLSLASFGKLCLGFAGLKIVHLFFSYHFSIKNVLHYMLVPIMDKINSFILVPFRLVFFFYFVHKIYQFDI